MEPLAFETYIDETQHSGQFVWGDERASIFERFYDAAELLEQGETTQAKNRLRSILKADPEFIDAYNSLGSEFFDRGNLKKALEYYQKAYDIGQRVLPNDFTGELVWGILDNRPFLRTLHGLGLCYMRSHRRKEAIALFERLLRYNPNDNQGIRYLLGDCYLEEGDVKQADVYLAASCDEYPPYRYSYGASLFLQHQPVPAIRQFWLGFYDNIYIAHAILRHVPLIAYQCYHLSSFEMPEIAQEYYSETLHLWLRHDDLREFVKKIYHTPRVQMRIQSMFECKHYLQYLRPENDDHMAKRQEIIEYMQQLFHEVTEEQAKLVHNDILSNRYV